MEKDINELINKLIVLIPFKKLKGFTDSLSELEEDDRYKDIYEWRRENERYDLSVLIENIKRGVLKNFSKDGKKSDETILAEAETKLKEINTEKKAAL